MSSRAVSHNPTQSFLWHALAMALTLIPVSFLGEGVWAATATRGGGRT